MTPEQQSKLAEIVALTKTIGEKVVIPILRVHDPLMWYAKYFSEFGPGVMVEFARVDMRRDGTFTIWGREPAGFINIIRFEDVKP